MSAFPPGAPNFQLPRPLRGVVYFDNGRLVVLIDGKKILEQDLAALASDTGERGVAGLDPLDLANAARIGQLEQELAALRAQPAGGVESDADRAYVRGLQAGYNLGVNEDAEGLAKQAEAYMREIRALTQPQPVEGGFPHVGLPADFPPEILEAAKKGTPDYWLGYLAGREVAPSESGGQGDAIGSVRGLGFISWANGVPPAGTKLYAHPPAQASAAVTDAARWRYLCEKRPTLLLTGFFGDGCMNRTVEEVAAIIDAALAQGGGNER